MTASLCVCVVGGRGGHVCVCLCVLCACLSGCVLGDGWVGVPFLKIATSKLILWTYYIYM